LHADAVRFRQDQREGIVGARLDRGVDIGVGVALIDATRRALAALPPDVAGSALLPDARLVLEEQPQPLIFVRTLYFYQGSQGSF
jgi:hypothetical protein